MKKESIKRRRSDCGRFWNLGNVTITGKRLKKVGKKVE